ncbi:MAG: N-methyl-L-tryptophan oxidase [Planctomycetota bacterium]|nr:N-methyl-L-tryptophan oxidase [Planctomycetota bacterium]MDA1177429.1 N-methyl-L-tryptophan oxidase [Planctomycetota bacterium]
MRQHYDTIVVGCGGIGSAALYHLARRGRKVLGIDRFGLAHDRGSSHGSTRVIRMAYYEHPDYVPLLQRAYQLWDDLEIEAGNRLFFRVGVMQTGAPDGEVVPGILESARQYQLPVERLTREQSCDRFPLFQVPAGFEVVYEQNAGYLLVEDCVRAHGQLAQRHGADWLSPCSVTQIVSEERAVKVVSQEGVFTCDSLVVAGGPWATELLREFKLPLQVVRKPLYWFPTRDQRYEPSRCPIFVFEVDQKFFYGFPQHDSRGIKMAQHFGGTVIDDPTNLARDVDANEQAEITDFAGRYLHGIDFPFSEHAVCMYTVTPDKHFIVDRQATDPRIVFACGMSGHGFKFASVIGEVLSELSIDGAAKLPIDFLRLDRFAKN